MNIQPSDQTGQALSDDQELAKVLAGVNNNDEGNSQDGALPNPSTQLGAMPGPQETSDDSAPADQSATNAPAASDEASDQLEVPMPTLPEVSPTSTDNMPPAAPTGDLESIKQEALGELRPLVDKLDVSPEEKFDTYLLLLRSTDDRELIAPAHEAAKAITDEARRAQALLDIIKEIDFLSKPDHTQQ